MEWVLHLEQVSEQMINGFICNNFTFYRTLLGVCIWWAKLFKAVLILLIALRLFGLLAPAGFRMMLGGGNILSLFLAEENGEDHFLS